MAAIEAAPDSFRMRLLLDQNLSPRLVGALVDLYPESLHVRDIGLQDADDDAVWFYARDHGLTIVSNDADFRQRSFLYGPPPKLIWIRFGNCSTAAVAVMLREHQSDLLAFELDADGSFLALG